MEVSNERPLGRARSAYYVSLYHESGLTPQDFCARHHLGYSTLYNWLKASKVKKAEAVPTSHFVSLEIIEPTAQESSPQAGAGLEVRTRSGTRISLPASIPVAHLVELVKGLESC